MQASLDTLTAQQSGRWTIWALLVWFIEINEQDYTKVVPCAKHASLRLEQKNKCHLLEIQSKKEPTLGKSCQILTFVHEIKSLHFVELAGRAGQPKGSQKARQIGSQTEESYRGGGAVPVPPETGGERPGRGARPSGGGGGGIASTPAAGTGGGPARGGGGRGHGMIMDEEEEGGSRRSYDE